MRFYPSQVRTLRHLAASDQEIEKEFSHFWATLGESPEKAQCRKAPQFFIGWLQADPAERSERFERAREGHESRLILAEALIANNPSIERRLATGANPIFSNECRTDATGETV